MLTATSWGALGSTALTANQRNTILASPLVQNNALLGNFIDIQPIVFAPEPGAVVLFALGLSMLLFVQRRQRRALSQK